MQRAMGEGKRGPVVAAVGIVAAAALVAVFSILPQSTPYDIWGALFLGPILIVITLPMLSRQARREGDRRLFWLLVAALALKLIGAIARFYVGEEVYGGVADATGYHGDGIEISERFRSGIFDTGLDSLTKTDFISFFTGLVYTFIGPSMLAGFMFYSWLAFLGLFLFYRAFTLAIPDGRNRLYACLLFFLPSLLYWPSSIGKEAWMMLTLGIAAFGAARLFTGRTWNGLAIIALGLWLGGIVRLHLAGMVALGLAFAYIVRKPAGDLRRRGVVTRILSLSAVVGLTVVVVFRAEASLRSSGISTRGGIARTLTDVAERTSGDPEGGSGSNFQPSVIRSPARIPAATFTVLFRPLPHEAHNAQALAASLETLLLLLLCVFRWRWILAAVTSFRRRPYVAMVLAYTAVFILGFSSFANLGLLTRQRVQLLPFLLVLFCIPPRSRRQSTSDLEERTRSRVGSKSIDAWDAPQLGSSVSDAGRGP